jgi:hypothetical protein
MTLAKWWDPIHHWVFAGLRLTGDVPSLIVQGGFQIEQMERRTLPHSQSRGRIVGGAPRFGHHAVVVGLVRAEQLKWEKVMNCCQ